MSRFGRLRGNDVHKCGPGKLGSDEGWARMIAAEQVEWVQIQGIGTGEGRPSWPKEKSWRALREVTYTFGT